jgi:hypothetical protein
VVATEEKEQGREELVQHLEKLTGRTFRTREDIQSYVREVSEREPRDDPKIRRWIKAKHVALAALLIYGLIQYYALDIMLQIVSIQSPTFFVSVRG